MDDVLQLFQLLEGVEVSIDGLGEGITTLLGSISAFKLFQNHQEGKNVKLTAITDTLTKGQNDLFDELTKLKLPNDSKPQDLTAIAKTANDALYSGNRANQKIADIITQLAIVTHNATQDNQRLRDRIYRSELSVTVLQDKVSFLEDTVTSLRRNINDITYEVRQGRSILGSEISELGDSVQVKVNNLETALQGGLDSITQGVDAKVNDLIVRVNAVASSQTLQGMQGERGLTGMQGVQGIPGINGVNGINGINGKDGVNGRDGINGKDGKFDMAELAGIQSSLVSIGAMISQQALPKLGTIQGELVSGIGVIEREIAGIEGGLSAVQMGAVLCQAFKSQCFNEGLNQWGEQAVKPGMTAAANLASTVLGNGVNHLENSAIYDLIINAVANVVQDNRIISMNQGLQAQSLMDHISDIYQTLYDAGVTSDPTKYQGLNIATPIETSLADSTNENLKAFVTGKPLNAADIVATIKANFKTYHDGLLAQTMPAPSGTPDTSMGGLEASINKYATDNPMTLGDVQ